MPKTEVLKSYVGELLDASSYNDMREVVNTVHIASVESYHLKDEVAVIEAAYEASRRKRQVVLAALGELVCRQAIEQMTQYFDEHDSLLLPEDEQTAIVDYDIYSPTVRRFLNTMHFWFNTALQEVATESSTLQKSLIEVGDGVYTDYKANVELWREKGRTTLPRAKDWTLYSNIVESYDYASLRPNYDLVGGMLIGRGVVTEGDKSEFARSQVGRIAALSSARLKISIPIFKEHPLDAYSQWEKGDIGEDEFITTVKDMPLAESDAIFHRSLQGGRWKNVGHCPATIPIVRPGEFTIPPEAFLKKLDVHIDEEIGMDHIITATAISVADETLYANWPKS